MNDSSFPLDIRLTQVVTDEDRQALFGWGDDVFGARNLRFHCRKSDWHYLGYADGQLVCHAGLVRAEVRVAGVPVPVGGIGGVVTVGSAQRRGYAQQLLRAALDYMSESWQVAFGMLFALPHRISFYQKLGWQEIQSPVTIEQPEGRVPSPVQALWLPVRQTSMWPAGPVELDLPW